jgi:alkylhydroperoxidase/carboxymuconolactone decarboxylase family protein YurZ
MEKFLGMATHPIRKGILEPKTFELIAIAVDASCTHMYAPGVRRHIRKALEVGATVEEILAVLQLTSILGIHSMALGAPILIEEAQKLAAEGPVQGTY